MVQLSSREKNASASDSRAHDLSMEKLNEYLEERELRINSLEQRNLTIQAEAELITLSHHSPK